MAVEDSRMVHDRQCCAELWDGAPVAICLVDAEGVIVDLNGQAAALLGRKDHEAPKGPFAGAVHVKDARRFAEQVHRCLHEDRRINFELTVNDAPSERVLEVFAKPVMRDGRRLCSLAFIDITRQRSMDATRDLLDEAARALLSTLQAGEVASRAAAVAVPRAADLCVIDLYDDNGWRRGALRHSDHSREDRLSRLGALPSALHDLARRASEARSLRRAEDVEDYREAVAIPLVAGGRLLGVMTLCSSRRRDVDPRFGEELGRRVSSALLNAARHAEVVAADAEKSKFLDQVSHELRTPLAAIYLWLHAARHTDSQAEREKALEAIDRSARNQSRMLADLVDLARAESGSLEIALERIELAPIVEQSVAGPRGEAEGRGIDLTFSAAADTGDVWVDAQRVRQIVAALIAHVLQQPGAGGVHVALERHGDEVWVIVSDGRPSPPDEPTEQAFESSISLALVRRLVVLHGGNARVESDGPGLGTRYVVCLPHLSSPH
jgi:PAS domain S-box-containing protein